MRLCTISLVLSILHLTLSIPLHANVDDQCSEKKVGKFPRCKPEESACLEKQLELCKKYPNCFDCKTVVGGEDNDYEVFDAEEVPPEIVVSEDDDEKAPDELKKPGKLIERNIIIENDNETQFYRGFIESGANITTIIRLTNLINNTNIVNMPTTLNNTNINNIHVYQNETSDEGGKFGLGYNGDGPCCYSLGAKFCKKSTTGPKCHHKREKVCGKQCTSKFIHLKPKNNCRYSPQWPYVECPGQQHGQGYYPPPFYPPPMMGYYPPPQAFYPPPPNFYPQQPPFIDETYDDDDLPQFPDDELLENPEAGWVVGAEKCKILSEDGLKLTNCDNAGTGFDHPFAKNPDTEKIGKRNARHAVHSQQSYPMMYPPFYPQPMYMPQYYYPPQSYYQQYPSYYENDDGMTHSDDKETHGARRSNPVIMDDVE